VRRTDIMQIGMVGLGRMGGNMARRLMRGGHKVVAWARNPKVVQELAGKGAVGTMALDDFVAKLAAPRVAWMMVPAGAATEQVVMDLATRLDPGDTLIDGGNSYFKDDVRRSRALRERRINYLDVGTSGGVWGLERGYCLMIGGDRAVVERLDPIFRTLAPGMGTISRTPGREMLGGTAEHGYLYCGPSGAGHFVKMVHNGIEYGLMQAYAEGLDISKNASSKELPEELRYDLNIADITELWRRGSVVSSWLLDLTAQALAENPTLSNYTGVVADSGEGRWTIMAAIEEAVPCDVLSAALYARFRSRQGHTFAEKVLSAMRHKFGGHVEQPAGGEEEGHDGGAGEGNPELVRRRQPRDADEPRASSEPRRARRHRTPRDSAGGPGVRARAGAVLRDEPGRVRSALPLRAGDRGRV